jgi:hypothetical protein
MTRKTGIALLVGALGVVLLYPTALLAEARKKKEEAKEPPCQAEETMVEDYEKGITDLVQTVREESLTDFRRAYHQKNCASKLTLGDGIMNIALECLDRAIQDPETTKDAKQACQTKRERYATLKSKVAQYRDELKATKAAADAKALIEKIDLSK